MPIPLAFGFLCLIWGSTWLAIKIGLAGFPPFLFAAVRCFAASLILFVLAKGQLGHVSFKPGGLKGPVVFGLLNGLGLGLVFWGEQYISSSLTATLNAAVPFFSAVTAYLLIGEKFTAPKLTGLVIGFIGVLVIFAENLGDFAGSKVLGETAIISAAVSYSLGGAYGKKHHNDLKPVVAVAIQQLFSAVILLPIGLLLERKVTVHFSLAAVAAFAYLVVVGSVIAFLLYYYLLIRIEYTKLSYLSLVTPGIAAIIGVAFGNEIFRLQYVAGLILIIGGMLVVNSGTFLRPVLRQPLGRK